MLGAAHLLSGLVLADCHENPVMSCENKYFVGKQGDLIFDCDLLLDSPLRVAGQMFSGQTSIIVCSCHKAVISAPL